MNFRNVRLIFLREVRDQLRDRRTLFMIAVLPLLLYPSLGVGMIQMTVLFREQPRTVVVLGADELPPPQLIDGDRFVAKWFDNPAAAERLRVVTAASAASATGAGQTDADALLAAAEEVRRAHLQVEQLEAAATAAVDPAEYARLAAEAEAAMQRRSGRFAASGAQVLILVPEGMQTQLDAANAHLRDRDAVQSVQVPRPVVLYNVADEKSLVAHNRVETVMGRWEAQLLKDRLRQANLPESLPTQMEPQTVDLARADERAASLWSKLFPALLVLMTVTGAFYPAVDLAAGEKERGTMETLLICPASRPEIVFGKFLTVMCFSVGTALLNLVSMGMTGKYMASFALGGAMSGAPGLAPPPLVALFWVAVLMVPLAALFSALCLALATFARSTKEGQYYLTPLLMVTIGITAFCLSPAVEITPLYSVLPVAGAALLLKELLAAGAHGYVYLAPVLLTSLGYAALALWWAVEQFRREDVLFREAERFELGLWLRHLLREKEATPSFSEAGFAFVLIMLLQFGAMKFMGEAMATAPEDAKSLTMLRLLMLQQIVIIATPVLLMGLMLTRSVGRTFRFRLPNWKFLAVGAVLPLALHPLCHTLVQSLDWFFGPLPTAAAEAMGAMQNEAVPFWLALLAFAVAPGICEELAFRGFILSGFLRSGRTWLAIALSSLCFGVMHMIPQQVFNATLVGLAIGLLAVRSGSLWPGVLFHILFNSWQVVLSRVGETELTGHRWDWLATADESGLYYSWPSLIVCGIVAAALLRWLAVSHRQRRRAADSAPPSPEATRPHDVAVPVG